MTAVQDGHLMSVILLKVVFGMRAEHLMEMDFANLEVVKTWRERIIATVVLIIINARM
jgi:hypothetical protein